MTDCPKTIVTKSLLYDWLEEEYDFGLLHDISHLMIGWRSAVSHLVIGWRRNKILVDCMIFLTS
jgi:hypothetical protein